MAIVRVKTTGKVRAAGSATIAMSFGTLPAAGNMIAVVVWAYEGSAAVGFGTGSCTDNQGNTYTRAINQARVSGTDNWEVAVYYAYNIGSPSGTFTVTVDATGASPTYVGAAYEYSGIATTDPLDKVVSAQGVDSTPATGSTATLAQADELVLAVEAAGGGGTQTIAVGGSFAELIVELDDNSWQAGEADELIVAATTAQSCSWSLDIGRHWVCCLATFKAQVGEPPPPPDPQMWLTRSIWQPIGV